eukprot:g2310.t1
MDSMDRVGAMVAEWARTNVLRMLATAIGIVMVWPYVLHLVSMVRQALDRAHPQERERAMALRALQERQREQPSPPQHRAPVGANNSSSSSSQQATAVLPPPQRRAAGAELGPPLHPEISPLTTLEELLGYERPGWGQGFAPARPLPFVAAPFPPLKSRLLVCHDYAGGYGEDRLVQGGGYDRAYRMYDWGLIDIFVYFSHNLVTIPPAGWIDVAHRHGTRVLGTFITEWDKGYDVCAELLGSEATADRAAEKLARIAADHGFDGWLVNIENKVDPGRNVDVLVHFVRSLTARMRAATSSPAAGRRDEHGSAGSSSSSSSRNDGCTVLWYDSVTMDGELKWQDRLNRKNRRFFDACDGIFSNYTWKADYPSASALEAEARRYDVYMGIDTFGRGTWGGGKFDVDKALGKIRRAGVSAALFAPSWTMEDETTGGGQVDPDPARGGWIETEQEFGEIDAEFWRRIGAAWHPPRSVPGGGGGGRGPSAGPPLLLPLLVNFGHGVGNAWRIEGEEVAVFGRSASAVAADQNSHLVVGGAFFDLASQCLTPVVGGACRGGASDVTVVQARRAGDSSKVPSQGMANGTIGARWSFAESFDGGSSLRFTGVLNEKAIATFPLYSCDVPLPAEPLEVRVTFCGNADSDVALVLSIDVLGQLGGRREVVLRDWGREGAPKKQAVFSKRQTFSESKTTYSPVREEHGRALSSGLASSTEASTEDDLQARVRALRNAGESYDAIWSRLRAERRSGNATDAAAGGNTNTNTSRGAANSTGGGGPSSGSGARWTTRTYVVRDLRMGGSRAIRELSVVCARRQNPAPPVSARGGAGREEEGIGDHPAARSSPSTSPPALRLGRSLAGEGVQAGGRGGGGGLRGVAGLAAYRAFLGEVAVGPWRRETPSTFGKIEGLRAEDMACCPGSASVSGPEEGSGGNGGAGADGGDGSAAAAPGVVVVDLSLAWDSEGGVGRGPIPASGDGVFGPGSPWATSHCDVWRACEQEEGGWRWLGRAYGRKYRLTGLRIDGSGGDGGGERDGGAALVLAVQQVNAMGYRQPQQDWARLQLSLR